MSRSKRIRIAPIDFSEAVAGLLDEYGKEAEDAIHEAMLDTAVEAMHKLREKKDFAPDPPVRPSGAYAASWTVEVNAQDRFRRDVVVYNENHYRLTHLLEKGHAFRTGGRTRAFPHIGPVNDWAQEEVIRKFEKELAKND